MPYWFAIEPIPKVVKAFGIWATCSNVKHKMCALSIFPKLLLVPIRIWAPKLKTFFFFYGEMTSGREQLARGTRQCFASEAQEHNCPSWRVAIYRQDNSRCQNNGACPTCLLFFQDEIEAGGESGGVCNCNSYCNSCGQMHVLTKASFLPGSKHASFVLNLSTFWLCPHFQKNVHMVLKCVSYPYIVPTLWPHCDPHPGPSLYGNDLTAFLTK